jgi:hypothetical protein
VYGVAIGTRYQQLSPEDRCTIANLHPQGARSGKSLQRYFLKCGLQQDFLGQLSSWAATSSELNHQVSKMPVHTNANDVDVQIGLAFGAGVIVEILLAKVGMQVFRLHANTLGNHPFNTDARRPARMGG